MTAGKRLVDEPLARAVEQAGLAHDLVPLEGGTYNYVFHGHTGDGLAVIVKVEPAPGSPALSYERDLLAVEADYFDAARAAGVPVPEVLAFDDGALLGRSVLVMSALGGGPYSDVDISARQGAEEDEDLCWQLGEAVAAAHGLRPSPWPYGFGYPYRAQALWRPTWAEAFRSMMEAVVADARRYAVELPLAEAPIARLLARAESALDEVTIPAMVHFDLWDGNLLVESVPALPPHRASTLGPAAERYRLTGIIDAERALSGDPLLEVPSLRHSRPLPAGSAYFQGYAKASGGSTHLEAPGAPIRIAMYTLYLSLVMLVEAAPRRYTGENAARRASRCIERICQQVAFLEQAL